MNANPQKAHYESMHDAYEGHYFDPTSLAYRRQFILSQLIGADDLSGMKIADIACGSGHNSLLLRELFPTIRTEGFDISAAACAAYSVNVGMPAHEVDITQPMDSHSIFDAAIIVGGLHHCVSDLDQAIANLRSILRPGGTLYLIEPNSAFVLQGLRSLWYRWDRYFDADTEHALDAADLERKADGFQRMRNFYFGGPAYFFVLNSLVTRVPLGVKSFISIPLFASETLWNRTMPSSFMAAFGTAWRRW